MDNRIIKYFSGELDEDAKRVLFEDAAADSELRRDMREAQYVSSLLALHPMQDDDQRGKESLEVFMRRRRRERRAAVMRAVLRYAAVAVLCVCVTFWAASMFRKDTVAVSAMQELTVPAGQRAHVKLSDGTGVWVNAGSVLRYPSAFRDERRVVIEGEALFEVAKGERPFIVSASGIDVKALGTKFNVLSYKGYPTTVSLLEGSVRVYQPDDESGGVVMLPDQQLTVKGTHFDIERIADDPVSWRNGIYAFNQQKLGNILKKIELYYDVKITVDDSQLLMTEYTGKFRQRDGVMEILRLFQKIHPFQIEKHDDSNEIVLRRRK